MGHLRSSRAPWSICIGNAEDEWTPGTLSLPRSEVQEMSNQEHAIMLGFESLGKNPDPRMVRTLITYLNRENRPSESFRLLGYMPKSHWRQEMERILQIRMNGPPPSLQGDVGHAPWLYELESDIQAGERLVFVQHRIPPRRRMRRRRLA